MRINCFEADKVTTGDDLFLYVGHYCMIVLSNGRDILKAYRCPTYRKRSSPVVTVTFGSITQRRLYSEDLGMYSGLMALIGDAA
jgi:hypothetical protein